MDEIMSKKVLYISYDGMTDPLGQSQVLPYLRELSKNGYEFHLVSFEKHERFLDHKKHIQKICDDAGIFWHPQDYHIAGGLRRTFKQIRKMKKVARYLHHRHSFQIVHCRSYIAAMAGLNLKRKYNVKMIFDMRGFWADERVDGGLWSLSNPLYKMIYKYFKRKEIQYLNESDYTISLTKAGMDEMLKWDGLQNKTPRIEIIPCCVDLNLFDTKNITEKDQSQLRDTLNLKVNDYVLGYIGSIGTWYMLDEMLDYFKILKKHKPQAKFLFVSGEQPESIQQRALDKNIEPSDLIITSCLHQNVPLHISIFDLSIFFIKPTYSKKASSPTKQGEIMAMGIPLICNSGVGDTDHIVETYNAGKVVSAFDSKTLEEAIIDETRFDKSRIIEGAHDFFSLTEGTDKYLSVYRKLDE